MIRLPTAWACTDIANSLGLGPRGPWLTDSDLDPGNTHTLLLPTILHQRKVPFQLRPVDDENTQYTDTMLPQTASLLPFDYGRRLDKQAAAADPFYALGDLFRFYAASENQVLNLLDEYTARETGHELLATEKPTLANLLYCQSLLEVHVRRLRDLAEVVHRRGGTGWPRLPQDGSLPSEKVNAAHSALEIDFQHMLRHAEAIAERCRKGMDVIMNNAMLAESKQAIAQAKRTARLTFIAFVYIPLSFTTSFFGMNVIEFVTGTSLSLWIWAAASIPVLLVTVAVFFIDGRVSVARARRFTGGSRKEYDQEAYEMRARYKPAS